MALHMDFATKFMNKVAASSDHGCNDQSVTIAWNVSPVSKHIKIPPVLVIDNSLIMIDFDEMTPQCMRIMTMKRGQKRYHQISPRNSASLSSNQPKKSLQAFRQISRNAASLSLNQLKELTSLF
ncbi:hypothetical protein AVEN_263794-1 [Araneus ventricosus]|uniref:Uncharacterized protein n=1 Tax=Araneus ventricosus TaxID=182803 RepID=A0A4Y2UR34_ARAVE|nr:hypothetical protein AVEN_263794-1 [Araneus ventricosus]